MNDTTIPKVERTARGFALINFTDRYGVACSLQKSSLATEDAIWLGCNDANPRHLVPGRSWQPVPMPAEYVADTRMHLTREQVAWLLPILQQFMETGEVAASQPEAATVVAVDERKQAEYAYSTTAFDYAENPIGSRDWTIYWAGWQARAALAAVPAQQPVAGQTAEDYLRNRYGAYRGHHAWRELEEAFNAGKAAQQPQREPWLLYLSDRADGVKGRYAIARWNPAGYREVWNLRTHEWTAFSDEVLTLEQAHELLKRLVIPTAQQPVAANLLHCADHMAVSGDLLLSAIAELQAAEVGVDEALTGDALDAADRAVESAQELANERTIAMREAIFEYRKRAKAKGGAA